MSDIMGDLNFLTRLPIAHRGLHNHNQKIVENSLGAVKAAIKHGYAIEIDVQLTKDAQAIVFHDESLERLVDKKGNVVDFTLSELTQMTYRLNDENILSFKQLLNIVNGQTPLIIEVKSLTNNIGPLETHIAQLISRYNGEICVMSFNPYTLKAFKKIAPQIKRGIVAEYHMKPQYWPNTGIFKRFIFKNLLHWPITKPNFISYHLHDLPTLAVRVARFFKIPVITWTVKSEQDAKHTYKYADQITFEGFLPPK